MIAWLAANWLTIVCIALVLGLVAVCLKNVLPQKGRPASCAGCSGGCASCSGGCSGCGR